MTTRDRPGIASSRTPATMLTIAMANSQPRPLASRLENAVNSSITPFGDPEDPDQQGELDDREQHMPDRVQADDQREHAEHDPGTAGLLRGRERRDEPVDARHDQLDAEDQTMAQIPAAIARMPKASIQPQCFRSARSPRPGGTPLTQLWSSSLGSLRGKPVERQSTDRFAGRAVAAHPPSG